MWFGWPKQPQTHHAHSLDGQFVVHRAAFSGEGDAYKLYRIFLFIKAQAKYRSVGDNGTEMKVHRHRPSEHFFGPSR